MFDVLSVHTNSSDIYTDKKEKLKKRIILGRKFDILGHLESNEVRIKALYFINLFCFYLSGIQHAKFKNFC
jgi:hypothetical protein